MHHVKSVKHLVIKQNIIFKKRTCAQYTAYICLLLLLAIRRIGEWGLRTHKQLPNSLHYPGWCLQTKIYFVKRKKNLLLRVMHWYQQSSKCADLQEWFQRLADINDMSTVLCKLITKFRPPGGTGVRRPLCSKRHRGRQARGNPINLLSTSRPRRVNSEIMSLMISLNA